MVRKIIVGVIVTVTGGSILFFFTRAFHRETIVVETRPPTRQIHQFTGRVAEDFNNFISDNEGKIVYLDILLNEYQSEDLEEHEEYIRFTVRNNPGELDLMTDAGGIVYDVFKGDNAYYLGGRPYSLNLKGHFKIVGVGTVMHQGYRHAKVSSVAVDN